MKNEPKRFSPTRPAPQLAPVTHLASTPSLQIVDGRLTVVKLLQR